MSDPCRFCNGMGTTMGSIADRGSDFNPVCRYCKGTKEHPLEQRYAIHVDPLRDDWTITCERCGVDCNGPMSLADWIKVVIKFHVCGETGGTMAPDDVQMHSKATCGHCYGQGSHTRSDGGGGYYPDRCGQCGGAGVLDTVITRKTLEARLKQSSPAERADVLTPREREELAELEELVDLRERSLENDVGGRCMMCGDAMQEGPRGVFTCDCPNRGYRPRPRSNIPGPVCECNGIGGHNYGCPMWSRPEG